MSIDIGILDGHFALRFLQDFFGTTNRSEENQEFSNPMHIIQTLLDDHQTIIRIIRNHIIPISEKYKDLGTADFVTGLMEKHEKMAWILRAYLS